MRGHSLCGKPGKTWSGSRRHEGGTAVTHLPWMPNNPGLLWPEAEREAVKIWGWLGVNGSPVTSSESPDGSCPCQDREQQGGQEKAPTYWSCTQCHGTCPCTQASSAPTRRVGLQVHPWPRGTSANFRPQPHYNFPLVRHPPLPTISRSDLPPIPSLMVLPQESPSTGRTPPCL